MFRRGGGEHPPPCPLMYIFNPATNRVKEQGAMSICLFKFSVFLFSSRSECQTDQRVKDLFSSTNGNTELPTVEQSRAKKFKFHPVLDSSWTWELRARAWENKHACKHKTTTQCFKQCVRWDFLERIGWPVLGPILEGESNFAASFTLFPSSCSDSEQKHASNKGKTRK